MCGLLHPDVDASSLEIELNRDYEFKVICPMNLVEELLINGWTA